MKKTLLILLLLPILATSCIKGDKNNNDLANNTGPYTVQGYLLSYSNGKPVTNVKIALSQSMWYTTDEPACVTDSNGYFNISYQPNGSLQLLHLHPWESNYDCQYANIDIIANLPKGQNLNLGNIYTSMFK